MAWGADAAQAYFAPAILFPLLVGVVLGALTVAMMRVGQVGNRVTVLSGLILSILLAVIGQHYIGYWKELQRSRKESTTFLRALALFPELTEGRQPIAPESFAEYMRWQAARGRQLSIANVVARDAAAWITWAVDALLLGIAALAMVIPALRQPYCSRCQSWYRTTRGGRLSSDAALRLASLAGVEIRQEPSGVRYRLTSCESACGPVRLALFWEDTSGDARTGTAWLSPQLRNQITQFLDQNRPDGPEPRTVEPDEHP